MYALKTYINWTLHGNALLLVESLYVVIVVLNFILKESM